MGLTNHVVVYHGSAPDYFEFSTDGKLTMHEGTDTRVVSYTQASDTTINITSFIGGSDVNWHCLLKLNAHDAVISTGFSYTPGGIFGRKVYLAR